MKDNAGKPDRVLSWQKTLPVTSSPPFPGSASTPHRLSVKTSSKASHSQFRRIIYPARMPLSHRIYPSTPHSSRRELVISVEKPEGADVVPSVILIKRSTKNEEAVYQPSRDPGQRVLENV